MKVAMLGSLPADYGGNGTGGIAVHTAELARHLAAQGVQVAVFAHNVSSLDGAGSNLVTKEAGFAVYPATPVRSGRAAALALRKAWRLARQDRPGGLRLSLRHRLAIELLSAQYDAFLSQVKPEVAHFHGAGLALAALCRAASSRGIPVIATIHSLRGHLPDEQFLGHVLPSLKHADRLIAVSHQLKQEAAAYGVLEARIHVVPNGVNAEHFHPVDRNQACRALGVSEEALNVLFVGLLIRRKGVDLLIRAFARVCEQVGNVHLYIAGGAVLSTDLPWYESTLTLPGMLRVADRVTFIGPIESRADLTLNLWYNAADVFVLPSRAEGMGLVLIEAMACGKPVIGTAVGGIQDVIRHRHNGLLVPPEDPVALAAAIGEVLGNPELAHRLGRNGLHDVQEQYQWDAVAEKVAEIYRDVAKTVS